MCIRLEHIPRLTVTQEEEPSLSLIWLSLMGPIAVTGQDDAAKAEWWPLSALPHLAFDHYDIMQDAIRVYNDLMK